jgi:branched-chain amino acid transport system permease protein
MTGVMLSQGLFNGLMAASIYILVSLGLVLIMSIMGILNLAHGEIYMLGAYLTYFLCIIAGLNYFVAIIVTIFILGIFGLVLEKFIFRIFRRNEHGRTIIMTMGLSLFLQTMAVVSFGTTDVIISNMLPGRVVIGSISFSKERVVAIGVCIILCGVLWALIQRTKIGQAMLAVSEDAEAASLQGINIYSVSAFAMFTACALAGVAGSLMGAIFSVNPFMGEFAIVKGIAVVVLGGMGSIKGVILGGLILGMVDALVPLLLTSQLASLASFITIIVILLFRPQGLFGHE